MPHLFQLIPAFTFNTWPVKPAAGKSALTEGFLIFLRQVFQEVVN